MATASDDMVAQLYTHGKAAKSKMGTLAAHVKTHKKSPNAQKIVDTGVAFRKIMTEVERFHDDMQKKPPALPEESAYKSIRAALTKIISVIVKLEKAIGKEEDDQDDNDVEPAPEAAPEPEPQSGVTEVECYSAARKELVGTDAKLAQALVQIATGVPGRTGPKDKDVPKFNHIHIGGNAKNNVLFQPNTRVVLGIIDFHIEKSNNKQQKEAVKKVAERSGAKTTLKVEGSKVST
ncbi:hypothetical protein ACERZ8_13920 [Tateyamaria armeniaca]|uniref:Uncharacterized protein n=1 Tax=Tateyamaria armeniaca TaxID=2518930 RepID=A0ABW8UZ08_9RHOB